MMTAATAAPKTVGRIAGALAPATVFRRLFTGFIPALITG